VAAPKTRGRPGFGNLNIKIQNPPQPDDCTARFEVKACLSGHLAELARLAGILSGRCHPTECLSPDRYQLLSAASNDVIVTASNFVIPTGPCVFGSAGYTTSMGSHTFASQKFQMYDINSRKRGDQVVP